MFEVLCILGLESSELACGRGFGAVTARAVVPLTCGPMRRGAHVSAAQLHVQLLTGSLSLGVTPRRNSEGIIPRLGGARAVATVPYPVGEAGSGVGPARQPHTRAGYFRAINKDPAVKRSPPGCGWVARFVPGRPASRRARGRRFPFLSLRPGLSAPSNWRVAF